MKIAMAVCSLEGIGGIAKHLIYLGREFSDMGHEVTIWAIDYDQERCYPGMTRHLNIHSLHPPKIEKKAPDLPGFRMADWLRKTYHSYREQKNLSLAIPAGFDVLNIHGNTISWAAFEYKRRHGAPLVWMCNDFWPPVSHRYGTQDRNWGGFKRKLKEAISTPLENYDRTAVRSIDKIAVLSERVKQQMQAHYGVNSKVIRAGVDVSKFIKGDGQKIRSNVQINPETFLLLSVCSLMPRRRLEDAIQAVKILVEQGIDIHYLIVGRTSHSPEYFKRLQTEITACELVHQIHMVGEVSEESLPDYYHACDAFLWASDENQSWGLAAMEAMATGKPVIVSRANGLADVLKDGHTAFLIPPRSPMKIAEVVTHLMMDKGLSDSIGRNGRRLVSESYSWRKNAEGMIALFEEAIESSCRSILLKGQNE